MTVPGTFVFLCTSCSYKARVPDEYRGATILCPGCHQPQLAVPAAASPSTGRTVSLLRVPTVPPSPSAPPPPPPPTPVARPATGSHARGASAAAEPAEATIEFCCTACSVRVRIPAHYQGKSILCPRCSTPQHALDASAPPRPMDTTRSLRAGRDGAVVEPLAAPAAGETRPDTTDMVPQRASVLPGQALEPEPGAVVPTTDALTRADARKRESVLDTAPLPAPAPVPVRDDTVTAPRAAALPAVPAALPGRPWPAIALAVLAVVLLLGLGLAVVAWRESSARASALEDEVRHLRQDMERQRPVAGQAQ